MIATFEFICNIGNVGVDEFNQDSPSITLYPNPTSHFVTVNLNIDNDQSFHYRLFDMSGKLLIENKIMDPNFKIEMSGYPKGIYCLLIENGMESFKEKIIVQ